MVGRDCWCKLTSEKNLDGARLMFQDLQSMAVHLAHQGRGVAKQLLQACLELVDDHWKEVYLESSEFGVRLYERLGFRRLEEITFLDR